MQRFSLVLTLALLSSTSAFAQEKDQPELVEGKTLEQWQKQLLKGSRNRRLMASMALAKFGARAIPVAAAALKDDDDGVRSSGLDVLSSLLAEDEDKQEVVKLPEFDTKVAPLLQAWLLAPQLSERSREPLLRFLVRAGKTGNEGAVTALRAALSGKNFYTREKSIEALGKIGPRASAAIPELLASSSSRAAKAVSQIGIKDCTPLIKILQDKTSKRRVFAIETLAGQGERASAALPDLLAATKDESSSVRDAAFAAIGPVGAGKKEAIEFLVKALKADGYSLPGKACKGLAAMGPKGASALDALHAAVEDKSGPQDGALKAIVKIAPSAKRTIDALTKAVEGNEIRSDALKLLHALGPKGAAAVPALCKLVVPKGYDADKAIWVLKAMGPASEPAVPTLVTFVSKATPENLLRVHTQAFEVLALHGTKSAAATPVVIGLLKEEKFSTSQTSDLLKLLGKIGVGRADAAGAAIAVCLWGDANGTGEVARETLALLKTDPQVAAKAFTAALQDSKQRLSAARSLVSLGAHAASGIPALETCLDDPDRKFSRSCFGALVAVGPKAVPALARALSAKTPEVRRDAGAALAELVQVAAKDVAQAVPQLMAALDDEDDAVVIVACKVLMKLKKLGNPAAKKLETLSKEHKERRVRSAAEDAHIRVR